MAALYPCSVLVLARFPGTAGVDTIGHDGVSPSGNSRKVLHRALVEQVPYSSPCQLDFSVGAEPAKNLDLFITLSINEYVSWKQGSYH